MNNLRKRLSEHAKTLSVSPLPSPSIDAPSPGNTPPHLSDNVQTMDMEMSDDDGNDSGDTGKRCWAEGEGHALFT